MEKLGIEQVDLEYFTRA